MNILARTALAGLVALAAAPAARADVLVMMSVEGPRGPFSSPDPAGPNVLKLTNVQVDVGGATSGTPATPKPVTITRNVDESSWQFLDAAAASDRLRVVITIARTASPGAPPQRRVLTLTNARIVNVHAGMDATGDAARALGTETIAFTYDRLDVEDGGARVFTSGS